MFSRCWLVRRLMEPRLRGFFWFLLGGKDCEPKNGLSLYWSHITYCCQLIPFSFLSPATSFSCGVTPPFLFFPFSSLYNPLWSLNDSVSLSPVTAIWLRKGREGKVPSALFVCHITAFSASFVKVCRLGTSDPIYWTLHCGEITDPRK